MNEMTFCECEFTEDEAVKIRAAMDHLGHTRWDLAIVHLALMGAAALMEGAMR